MVYYSPLLRRGVHPGGGGGGTDHLCTVCGKSFPEKWRLARHQKIHTEQKPYKCHLCPYEGRLKECLRRHLKSRHDALYDRVGGGSPSNGNNLDEAVMREIYNKLAQEAVPDSRQPYLPS